MVSGEKVHVWVSKYAITRWPFEADGELYPRTSGGFYVTNNGGLFLVMGVDAHLKREDAVAAAERMRQSKIKSLEKQLKKLRDMRFE